jgi:hypothetical protein
MARSRSKEKNSKKIFFVNVGSEYGRKNQNFRFFKIFFTRKNLKKVLKNFWGVEKFLGFLKKMVKI